MLWPRRVLLMYQTSHEISYLYIRNSAPQDRGKQRPLRDGPIGPGPPARPALTTHPQLLVYAATTRRCIAASFGNCIGVGKSEGRANENGKKRENSAAKDSIEHSRGLLQRCYMCAYCG